jgi:hypothetical protein
MKSLNLLLTLSFACLSILCADALGKEPDSPAHSGPVLSIVSHHWVTKVSASNFVAVRPGSVYDIRTYFEQRAGLIRPTFNYIFHDTGLGTADALYPVFQTGYQGHWGQLIPALFSEKNRHIDHYSTGITPEGCRVESAYWVRHIDEFPDMYQEERQQGYTLIDIGFDYYIKERPDAQCGRHRAFDPDPDFYPIQELKKYAVDFRVLADIPDNLLNKFEAKIALLRLVDEEFSRKKWPRFDEIYSIDKNSLWYYPDGHAKDYGFNSRFDLGQGNKSIDQSEKLIVEADQLLRNSIELDNLLEDYEFKKLLQFLQGQPTVDFDLTHEPGKDALRLSDVDSKKHFYSRGLEVIPIENVYADVADIENYKLASIVVRPFQQVADTKFESERVVPQLRFIFQLHRENQPLEQLFLHLIFDGVDRYGTAELRRVQQLEFLNAWNDVISRADSEDYQEMLLAFIGKYSQRPVQELNFSSALTGIWIFGSLSQTKGPGDGLQAVRIERKGIDVGYYSSAWDNRLFRDAMNEAEPLRRQELSDHLQQVTPEFYRDPRRTDVHAIKFNEMTCAQCHHMSARDGVHVSLNDKVDRRNTAITKASEFTYRELQRQLQFGEFYLKDWLN